MEQPADVAPIRAKLPFQFDEGRLLSDLAQIRIEEWVPHFNTACYEGGWSVAPLRSIDGESNRIYPDPSLDGDRYRDTELLARCPYFNEVLNSLEAPLFAVRLMRLAAGAVIKTHRDFRLGYKDGEVRLHVPVVTNPGVEFIIAGERAVMLPGECWFHDFSLPHSVANHGSEDRIHLVIDCQVTPGLGKLLRDYAY